MKILPSAILMLSALALFAFGHNPVIVKDQSSKEKPVLVTRPEISYAYYGELGGEPHYYKIKATKPFHFYVNILVPDFAPKSAAISSHDMSFEVGRGEVVLVAGEGPSFVWSRFYEKYGRDNYYLGPSYEADFGAGTYVIKVYNSINIGRYALAIGKKEKFTPWSLIGALIKARSLDKWFFKPPAQK